MKLFQASLLPVIALLLSGCFDMSQQIWVEEGGAARMEYRLGLDEKLLELNGGGDSDDVCATYRARKRELEQLDGVNSVTVSEQSQAGIRYCTLALQVKHFTVLPRLHTLIMARAGQGMGPSEAEVKTVFELSDNQDGSGDFLQQISNRAGDPDKHPLDAQAEQIANVVMAQMLAGRYWTVTLHAPTITAANGELAGDSKSVQWKVPLHDLLMDKDYITEMNAEFEFDLPWYKRIWKWVS